MSYKEMNVTELDMNPFTKISKQWMLITAGNEEKANTMTASWGGVGFIWNKNAITLYIRPQRYTKEFVDANDTLTVSFLPEQYREALNICGKISGRDEDKITKAGLTLAYEEGVPFFEEAELVFVCKKMYVQEMKKEGLLDQTFDSTYYPNEDYSSARFCNSVETPHTCSRAGQRGPSTIHETAAYPYLQYQLR